MFLEQEYILQETTYVDKGLWVYGLSEEPKKWHRWRLDHLQLTHINILPETRVQEYSFKMLQLK